MLTKEVSQKYFNNALVSIHATRGRSLFETSWSLIKGSSLTISSLGQNREGQAYIKHKIKSVDRLVGSAKLHAELATVYKEFFYPYLVSLSKIYLLVDWSGCCNEEIHMLRASVVQDGRSVTIYNEIHPQEKLGNRQVQTQFLLNLYKQIPFGKEVVIITDAGFVTPWFHAVLKLGWHYVGRIKGDVKLLFDDRPRWMCTRHLHKTAKAKVRYEGYACIGSASDTPVKGNIYSYKKKPKKRKGQSRYPDINKRYAKANKSPWIIATSLNNTQYSKEAIKDLYEKRMQIEQVFRDDKAPRFGFGWRLARNGNRSRIAVLCLIANIAAFFLFHLGMLAEKTGIRFKFQVNTIRHKRVLSCLNLAKQLIKHGPPVTLIKSYETAFIQLFTNKEVLYGR